LVHINPQQQSLVLDKGQSQSVQFTISTDNIFLCKTYCEYKLIDTSSNQIIFEGNTTVKPREKVHISYDFTAPMFGTGQKIYNFNVGCFNMKTALCTTKATPKMETSFITMNYKMGLSEKELYDAAKKQYENFLENISMLDIRMQNINNNFENAKGKIKTDLLAMQKSDLDYEFDSSLSRINDLRNCWDDEKYNEMINILSNGTQKLSNLISVFEINFTDITNRHNQMSFLIKSKADAVNYADNETYSKFMDFYQKFKSLEFENYELAENESQNLSVQIDLSVQNTQSKGIELVNNEYNILCSLKDYCLKPLENSNFSIENMKTICSSIKNLKNIYPKSMDTYSYNYALNSNITISSTEGAFDYIYNLLNLSDLGYADIERNNLLVNETEKINLVEMEKLSAKINYTSDLISYDYNYCTEKNTTIELDIFEMQNFNFTSRINTTVEEHLPMCCVFGNCRVCCVNASCANEAYPIIFVHGHSFNKDNSPKFSLEVFDKIIAELEKNGYVNAGIVLPTSKYADVSEAEWGLSGAPLLIKISYYYDVYDSNGTYLNVPKNSEHISEYAKRLDELVKLIKYRTEKDKVIIVAHSMGGLVSREYLKDFGDDSVDKLIMFGTPNNGTFGQTEKLCPITGEKIECEEMSAGSEFLKELNYYAPENAKLYAIIGTGCNMSGFDGDGVVTKESVNLSYAENFVLEGSCPGYFDLLHNSITDISKYPKAREILNDILKN